jgi:helicase MOV-10
VKGLAEGRPSVLVGDFILFSHAVNSKSEDVFDPNRTWFQGCVHQVHQNYVSLRFGGDFSVFRGSKFDVRFVLNRLPLRRMHDALANTFNPTRLLFPGPRNIISARVTPAEIRDITPVYRPLREDEEQLETVAAIVNQRPGSVPFVVFGP